MDYLKEDTANNNSSSSDTNETYLNYVKEVKENPIATITMDSGEEIKIELMPSIAPNTASQWFRRQIRRWQFKGLFRCG